MKAIADVKGISVVLDIDDRKSLFVLVAEDGTINRMGSGTLDTTQQGLFIGNTDPAVFAAVRSHLTEAMLQITGRTFEAKNPRGAACKLKILWQFRDGTSGGCVFCYGAESEGPPNFVADFVRAAVSKTDQWYEEFKRPAASQRKP